MSPLLQAADPVNMDIAGGKVTATISLKSPSNYNLVSQKTGALVIGKLDKSVTTVEAEISFKVKEAGWTIESSLKSSTLTIPIGSTGTVNWKITPPPETGGTPRPKNETQKPTSGTIKIDAAAFRIYFNGSANDETDDVILVSQSGGSKASPPDGELDVEIKSPVSITVDLAQSNADGKIKLGKSKVSGATLNAKVDLNGLEPSSKKNATEVSGKAHGFEVKNDLTVMKISLESLSFNYDDQHDDSDAISIRKSFSGSQISAPEWEAGGKSDPAAYIKGRAVKIQPGFKIEPVEVAAKFKVKAVSTDKEGVLGDIKETEFDAAANKPTLMELEKNIPDKISKTTEAWDWKLTSFNGKKPVNGDLGKSSDHIIYVLWDEPKYPWDSKNQIPWVNALEFIMVTADTNKATDVEALSKITNFCFQGHGLAYDTVEGRPSYCDKPLTTFNLTNYIKKTNNKVNCYDQAGAVVTLSRMIGIDALYQKMEPYGYINPTKLVGVVKLCNNPFFNSPALSQKGKGVENVPENDVFDNRTPFSNHAFVLYKEKVYDACQGPYLGKLTQAQYINVCVDDSTPAERKSGNTRVAGTVNDILTQHKPDLVK